MKRILLALCAMLAIAGCGETRTVTHTTTVALSAIGPTGPASPTCAAGIMGGCVTHPASLPRAVAPPTAGVRVFPDVSEYQACALHSEAVFRIYEAGTDREDSTAVCHAAELRHVWKGAYAFLRASRPCGYEAGRAVAIAERLPSRPKVIIADAERGLRGGFVACFLHDVARAGFATAEYTCPGCGDEQVGPVWIAAYPFRPAGRWVAHQFTDTANCRGVFGDCSVDEGITSLGQSRSALLARQRTLRRVLLADGCRARVRRHERLGPKCRRWFREGNTIKRELA